MARKNAVQAAEDQIKDQAFSELQDLIAESEKLLSDSASLVGEEGETLRAQVGLKLKQALDSVSNVRERTKPVWMRPKTISVAIHGKPWPSPPVSAWWWACCWAVATSQRSDSLKAPHCHGEGLFQFSNQTHIHI